MRYTTPDKWNPAAGGFWNLPIWNPCRTVRPSMPALGGWTNLAGEEHADRIDRIFVYGAAGFEHLSLPDIFSILDQRTDTGMN